MALTVTTGGGTPALVQNGTITAWTNVPSAVAITPTLPAASTAGSCLVVILAIAGNVGAGDSGWLFPSGWALLKSVQVNTTSELAMYAYLNNPGGIQTASFKYVGSGLTLATIAHMSEWSNVLAASALDTSGTATATSGTTLAPTTAGNVSLVNSVAISAWVQIVTLSTVTFTTPAGFTRLIDNQAVSSTAHLDAEYKINPATGATLGPTLTSTGTTTSASGAIIVLKPVRVSTDQSAVLEYGSLTLKLNTADFALIDPATVPALGEAVAFTTPTWNGRVVQVTTSDIVDVRSGHKRITIAATNAATAPGGAPPFNMSDVPNGTTLRSYSNLTIAQAQNIDGTVTVHGSFLTYDTGLVAGMSIQITSNNLGLSAAAYTITQVTITFQGANPPSPAYWVEFGDPFPTLAGSGAGALVNLPGKLGAAGGVVLPSGVLGYAQVVANQTGISATTDLTGLALTVQVAAGRRIRITGHCRLQQNTGAAQVVLAIQEGATVLNIETIQAAIGTLPGVVIGVIQPSTGAHTYKLTLATGANTVDLLAGATNPAWLIIEDIGT